MQSKPTNCVRKLCAGLKSNYHGTHYHSRQVLKCSMLYFYLSVMSLDPVLTVMISPLTQTILDVAPLNRLSLLCNASSSSLEIVTMKTVAWTFEPRNGPSQPLFHNGLSTNITDYSLGSTSSASVFSSYSVSAGVLNYVCKFSFQVPGDPPVQSTQSAEVVVKGQ